MATIFFLLIGKLGGAVAVTDPSYGCAHAQSLYQPGAVAMDLYAPGATMMSLYQPGAKEQDIACQL